MLNYGWVCPKCGRVYAPNQEMCLYCVGGSISSPVTPPKKIQDGISWTSGYCDNLGSTTHATNTITDSNWMTVTSSSCGEAISGVNASNDTVVNKDLELKSLIENSVKEKLDETTVRASTN